MNSEPPILKVGQEPPPMHRWNGSTPARHQGNGKAKGKPARRSTGDRFAVLNAFVDAGMIEVFSGGNRPGLAGALPRHPEGHRLHQHERHCHP